LPAALCGYRRLEVTIRPPAAARPKTHFVDVSRTFLGGSSDDKEIARLFTGDKSTRERGTAVSFAIEGDA